MDKHVDFPGESAFAELSQSQDTVEFCFVLFFPFLLIEMEQELPSIGSLHKGPHKQGWTTIQAEMQKQLSPTGGTGLLSWATTFLIVYTNKNLQSEPEEGTEARPSNN